MNLILCLPQLRRIIQELICKTEDSKIEHANIQKQTMLCKSNE